MILLSPHHTVSVMLNYEVTAVLLLLCLAVLSQSDHGHQERAEAGQEFINKNPTESEEEVKEERLEVESGGVDGRFVSGGGSEGETESERAAVEGVERS